MSNDRHPFGEWDKPKKVHIERFSLVSQMYGAAKLSTLGECWSVHRRFGLGRCNEIYKCKRTGCHAAEPELEWAEKAYQRELKHYCSDIKKMVRISTLHDERLAYLKAKLNGS
jgi:hypothetical protein